MLDFESIAQAIRNQLVAANLCGGNVERERNEPGTDDDLPYALINVGMDDAKPDGDERTGIPRFVHTVTIVVACYDKADTGLALKTALATHAGAVYASLFGNLAWQGGLVEGISGARQIYETPPEGNHLSGRVQVQLDIKLRSSWPPALPADDLATVGVGLDVPDGTPQPGITIDVPTE